MNVNIGPLWRLLIISFSGLWTWGYVAAASFENVLAKACSE